MLRAKQEVNDRPTNPTEKTARLRFALIKEELKEFAAGMGLELDDKMDIVSFSQEKVDLVESYDGLLDILYVTYGAFVSLGMNSQPGWDEVCRSNNTKFAEGYSFREDGKLIKSPKYSPANLKSVLEKQKKETPAKLRLPNG